MRESNAVLLGFALVAFVMVAVGAYVVLVIARTKPAGETRLDNPVSKAFSSTPFSSNGESRPVPAVEALLPLGTPAAEAIGKFTADDFTCSRTSQEATCTRKVAYPSANAVWKVTMTFDASDRLVSRSATHNGNSL